MNSDMLQGFTAAPLLNYALKKQRRGDLIWDADERQQNAPGYLFGPYNRVMVCDEGLEDTGELTSYDAIGGWLNLIERA